MKEYNVHEVLAILKKYYITDAIDAQMVTRWIRDGKLHGVRGNNRKEGYRVSEDDLFEFIEEHRPGLPAIMKIYEQHIDSLNPEEQTKDKVITIVESEDNLKDNEQSSKIQIEQLQRQITYLESKIIELEEDNQRIGETVIDIQQRYNSLNEQNKLLMEEKIQFFQLNVLLKKEIELLKSAKLKNQDELNSKEKPVTPITQSEFMEIGYKLIDEIKLIITGEGQKRYHLIQIYDKIYDEDGNIRKECIKDGRFKCPFSGKSYKQQKRLVMTAIKTYLETNRKEIENELNEKTMMN